MGRRSGRQPLVPRRPTGRHGTGHQTTKGWTRWDCEARRWLIPHFQLGSLRHLPWFSRRRIQGSHIGNSLTCRHRPRHQTQRPTDSHLSEVGGSVRALAALGPACGRVAAASCFASRACTTRTCGSADSCRSRLPGVRAATVCTPTRSGSRSGAYQRRTASTRRLSSSSSRTDSCQARCPSGRAGSSSGTLRDPLWRWLSRPGACGSFCDASTLVPSSRANQPGKAAGECECPRDGHGAPRARPRGKGAARGRSSILRAGSWRAACGGD